MVREDPWPAAAVLCSTAAPACLPHQAQSPLSPAANVHFDAATPNTFIQECFDEFHVAWARDVLADFPTSQDGLLAPSDAPGLGVTVNEAGPGKHPYGERNFMNLFSAGWERRNP
jgi:L-alanine-DL-glutamate epimerase-like enolase superfamily enzyme